MYKMENTTNTTVDTKTILTSTLITVINSKMSAIDLHDNLKQYKNTKYVITKQLTDTQIVSYITLVRNVRLSAIHKIVKSVCQVGEVSYAKVSHYNKVIDELKVDEGECMEHGELPKSNTRNKNEVVLEAIDKAEKGDTEGALEIIKQDLPWEWLNQKSQLETSFQNISKIQKKYDLPDMKNNITLNQKQKQVWDLLQGPPQARRIIWVSGQYGSGKSFLMNYMALNHEYRLFNAGQTCSLNNLAQSYNEEGVIAWDLPRTFNFGDYGDAISNVIEKFSDFGQTIQSTMYKGKTQYIRGHVVVFSNHEPLEQLKHRDIIHIDLSPDSQEEVKPDEIEMQEPERVPATKSKTVDMKLTKQEEKDKDEVREIIKKEHMVIRHLSNHTHIKVVSVKNEKTGKYSCVHKYLVQLHNPSGYLVTKLLDNEKDAINYCPQGYTIP